MLLVELIELHQQLLGKTVKIELLSVVVICVVAVLNELLLVASGINCKIQVAIAGIASTTGCAVASPVHI